MRTCLAFLIVGSLFTASPSFAEVLKCKIDGYQGDVFITTPPDLNSEDGKSARVGTSPGLGNKAIVHDDRMGATVFVELNGDGTPIGLITVATNMRVVNSRHSIDPSGSVLAPSQKTGLCVRCLSLRACAP